MRRVHSSPRHPPQRLSHAHGRAYRPPTGAEIRRADPAAGHRRLDRRQHGPARFRDPPQRRTGTTCRAAVADPWQRACRCDRTRPAAACGTDADTRHIDLRFRQSCCVRAVRSAPSDSVSLPRRGHEPGLGRSSARRSPSFAGTGSCSGNPPIDRYGRRATRPAFDAVAIRSPGAERCDGEGPHQRWRAALARQRWWWQTTAMPMASV
jgi:hypothetical protein